MKVRNGFVSNSSSSSFLVLFPREPKSISDVREILFDPDQEYYSSEWDDKGYSVDTVSETVFNDINEQEKNDLIKAKEILEGSYESGIDYDDFKNDSGKIDWDAYSDAQDKWADKFLSEFFSLKKIRKNKINRIVGKSYDNNGEILYVFTYSDDYTYGSALEHGDLFRKLKHFRVSHH